MNDIPVGIEDKIDKVLTTYEKYVEALEQKLEEADERNKQLADELVAVKSELDELKEKTKDSFKPLDLFGEDNNFDVYPQNPRYYNPSDLTWFSNGTSSRDMSNYNNTFNSSNICSLRKEYSIMKSWWHNEGS